MAIFFKSVDDPELATLLGQGAVGVIPTDTIYGLVARTTDPIAVARLYALKHREKKPGTVIAANVDQLSKLGVDGDSLKRASLYWPNPISIILKPGESFSYIHQEVGDSPFRVVSDSDLRLLLLQTGALITTSANLPGELPARTVKEAVDYFGDKVDFYVDGGDRFDRQPSTIVRLTDDGLEIIRQGAFVIPSKDGPVNMDHPKAHAGVTR